MTTVSQFMDLLRSAETRNEHLERPQTYCVMAWGGEYYLHLAEWSDQKGEKRLILTASHYSEKTTIYPHATMVKVLKTTRLAEEYPHWIVCAQNGDRFECYATEKELKEWKRTQKKD